MGKSLFRNCLGDEGETKGTQEHFLINGFTYDDKEIPQVPEPTSLAIFGLGTLCMGFGAARRRRKEKENSD
ncbi:MAG: hypothetical protein COA78_37615 [Blastopirellula sp.]|nr:MAG: hypothetical protein COA78_37615 [Blastopirellula sp.]